jgi:Spy/CpxP family protein refolding chaperone
MPREKTQPSKEAVMKKRNILISTLFSVMLVTGLAACKHGRSCGSFDEFDRQAVVNRVASHLDLSESQKAELQDIVGEFADRVKALHADRQAHHRELADLVRQETVSRQTVDRMVAEKLDRMKELADLAADRLIAFHATLTPGQREKLAAHIEAHAADRAWCQE